MENGVHARAWQAPNLRANSHFHRPPSENQKSHDQHRAAAGEGLMLRAMTPVAGKEINKKGAKNCCLNADGGLRSVADLDAQAGWVLLLRNGQADGVAAG